MMAAFVLYTHRQNYENWIDYKIYHSLGATS